MHDLRELAWPTSSLDAALVALAREAGLPLPHTTPTTALPSTQNDEDVFAWLAHAGGRMGLELEATETRRADLDRTIRAVAPAVLRIETSAYLLVVKNGLTRATVLSPARELVDVTYADIASAVWAFARGSSTARLDRIMRYAKGGGRAQARVRTALESLIWKRPIEGIWLVRMPASARFRDHLRTAGLFRHLGVLLCLHAASYVLFIASWWMATQGALLGYRDPTWLAGWVLALFSLIPLQVLVTWMEGRFVLGAGALLKQRLLGGALRLDIDALRLEGAGQLLGRTIDTNTIETLALSGGVAAIISFFEILSAIGFLAYSVGVYAVGLFMFAALGVIVLARRSYLERGEWSAARLGMTHDMVERMVGHRTRVVQEPESHWHIDEDRTLERYTALSKVADRSAALLFVMPRGWLLLGIASLAFVFSRGGATSDIVLGLGGVLLGYQAFARLSASSQNLINALIAWKNVEPVFSAASSDPMRGTVMLPSSREGRAADQPVVEVIDATYRYAGRGRPVLHSCSLAIHPGDRVLIEGPSGGGKSTLGLVLAGLRRPESGLVLASGLDEITLGLEGWRQRVASSPQFHENHVLSATLAFNLLMGRQWPPSQADMRDAERVCRDLALGDLLDRMPSGMSQILGESGWQLSHGERSRLFLARALLQRTDAIVLDECFGALDPETLSVALDCVLKADPAVVVIAHP